MYEAKQNKEKVSRTIGGGNGARQRVEMTSNRKNNLILESGNVQNHIIQAVSDKGFRNILGTSGYITLAVDRKNLGHTYIVIETRNGVWMYHFRANAVNGLTRFAKMFAWKGTFEEIKKRNDRGKKPQDFINGRSMSFSELKVSGKKAMNIKNKCMNSIGEGLFSLVLSNVGLGNNCFSKVYNILKNAGFQLTWSSYLLSFISPRLAVWLGGGFYDNSNSGNRYKKSTYFPSQRICNPSAMNIRICNPKR